MTTVARLVTSMEADVTGLRAGVREAITQYNQLARSAEQSAARMDASTKRMAGGLTALGVGFGVRELITYADAWTNTGKSISTVTDSQEELIRVQKQLFNLAQGTFTSLTSTVKLYQNLALSTKSLGYNQSQLVTVTKAVNQALALGPSTATTAAAAVQQLGQAFAAGVLNGDEFRSVMENAPIIVNVLGKALNKTRGELREMSAAGVLTAQIVGDALIANAEEIDAAFRKMPITIGQGLTQVQNSIARFIGETADGGVAANTLASGLRILAANFDAVANAALIAGVAYVTRFMTPTVAAAGKFIAAQVAMFRAVQAGDAVLLGSATAQRMKRDSIIASAAANTAATRASDVAAVAYGRQAAAAVRATTAELALATAVAAAADAQVLRHTGPGPARDSAGKFTTRNVDGALALQAAANTRLAAASRAATIANQSLALSNNLVASTSAIAGQAIRAQSAALVGQAIAFTSVGAASTVAKLAVVGLRNVMAFFGGPVGLAILAVGVALFKIAEYFSKASEKAREFAAAEKAATERAVELNAALLAGQAGLIERAGTISKVLRTYDAAGKGAALMVQKQQKAFSDAKQAFSKYAGGIQGTEKEISEAFERALGAVGEVGDAARNMLRLAQQANKDEDRWAAIIGTDSAKANAKEVRDVLELLKERVNFITDSFRSVEGTGDFLPGLGGETVQLLADLEAKLAAMPTKVGKVQNALRDMINTIKQTPALVQLPGPGAIQDTFNRDLKIIKLAPLSVDVIPNVFLSPDEIKRLRLAIKIDNIFGDYEEFADATDRIGDSFEKIGGSVAKIGSLIRGVVSGMDSLKRASAEGASNLAKVSGVFSAIVAVTSAVGDALYGGAREREASREAALIENTRAIQAATLAQELGTTGGRAAELAAAGAANIDKYLRGEFRNSNERVRLGDTEKGFQAFLDKEGFTLGNQLKVLEPVMKDLGLTFAQLNAIAKDNGISLLNDKGRIVAGAFGQLSEILSITADRMTKFADDVGGRRSFSDLYAEVFDFDTNDASVTIAREVSQLFGAGSPLADIFSQFNVTTEQGRLGFETALRSLALSLDPKNGNLALGDLGELELDDLIKFITNTDKALDSFTETTNAATAAMRNVPTGYKIAQRIFESTAGGLAPGRTKPTSVPVLALPPSFLNRALGGSSATSTGSTASLGQTPPAVVSPTLTIAPGAIVVNGTDKNPQQVAQEVLGAFKDAAQRQSGNSTLWPNIQTVI